MSIAHFVSKAIQVFAADSDLYEAMGLCLALGSAILEAQCVRVCMCGAHLGVLNSVALCGLPPIALA